jgi:hypothetical protein
MLYDFHDRLLLEYKKWWFVWEEAWDAFRPINGIAWNGTAFVLDDAEYCSDPLNPMYGYRTQTMKDLCDLLGDLKVDDVRTELITPPLPSLEWFYDRRVPLTPCAPRDHESWKRMVQSHGRTCRKAPKGANFTRRRVCI